MLVKTAKNLSQLRTSLSNCMPLVSFLFTMPDRQLRLTVAWWSEGLRYYETS